MSSISSLSSSNPLSTTNQNPYAQFFQNLNAIGSALQSPNGLSAAQSALATFQQNLPASSQTSAASSNSQTSASGPFGKNTQANTDYQNLVTALNSGNTADAQKAFASLQSDLKSVHKGHHHHHGSGSATSSAPIPASTTTTPTDANATDTTLDNAGIQDSSSLNTTA